MMKNPNIGSSFDSFLEEDGLLAEVQAEAFKRVVAFQIKQYLEETNTKKSAFAMLNQWVLAEANLIDCSILKIPALV